MVYLYFKIIKFAKLLIIQKEIIIFATEIETTTMNIEFEDPALEELYTTGKTQDHKYNRLSKNIVKSFVKVVNYMKAWGRDHSQRIDFWNFQALWVGRI